MNRLLLGSALAAALAAGLFIFWPAANSPEEGPKPSAASISRAASPSLAGPDEPFKESRVKSASVSAVAGPFGKRAAEIAAAPPTTEREDAIRALAHEWAAKDPAGAERWAAAFEAPADLNRALTHVCLEVAVRNPRDAIEMARWYQLGDGTVEGIVGQWAESDFAAAAAWVNGVPEGNTRNALLARIAMSRAEAAPEEAASIVATALVAGKVQEEAAISVLYQWLRKDPEAARQWVDTFPEGPLKKRASSEVQGMTAYRRDRLTAP